MCCIDDEVKLSSVWVCLNCILSSVQHCNSGVIIEQPSPISNISLSCCTVYWLHCKNIFLCIKTNPFFAYPQAFIHSLHVTHDKQSVYSGNNGYRGLGQTKMFSLKKLVKKNKKKHTFWIKKNTNKNNLILFAGPVGENIYTGCFGKWCQICFEFWKFSVIFERKFDGIELKK